MMRLWKGIGMKAISFTARKAAHLNRKEDGLIIRSSRIESKTKYNRKDKAWKRDI